MAGSNNLEEAQVHMIWEVVQDAFNASTKFLFEQDAAKKVRSIHCIITHELVTITNTGTVTFCLKQSSIESTASAKKLNPKLSAQYNVITLLECILACKFINHDIRYNKKWKSYLVINPCCMRGKNLPSCLRVTLLTHIFCFFFFITRTLCDKKMFRNCLNFWTNKSMYTYLNWQWHSLKALTAVCHRQRWLKSMTLWLSPN